MTDTLAGLASLAGLKLLVGGAIVAAFLASYSAPAQLARLDAEAEHAARLATCLAASPTPADAFGRFLARQSCRIKVGGR